MSYYGQIVVVGGFPWGASEPPVTPPEEYVEEHYVTQNGAGSRNGSSIGNAWSLNDFHSSTNWTTIKETNGKIGPGDVVYFSGTFTDRGMIARGGTSDGSITLDGFEPGNTNPIQSVNTGTALLTKGMELRSATQSITDLVIQDFRMTDPQGFRPTLNFRGSAPDKTYPFRRNIVRRNYIYDSGERFLTFFYGYHNIIVDNKFYVFGKANDPDSGKYVQGALSIVEFHNGLFARNEVGHDGSPIQSAPSGSPELVHTHGCHNILIERNNLYGVTRQSGLRPKEWSRNYSINNVIRFNKIHNNPHPTSGKGLYLRTNYDSGSNDYLKDFYIYGNYIYNNGTHGILLGGGLEGGIYIWSNILSDNGHGGISSWQSHIGNLHIYNNTIARNNTSGDTDWTRGGIILPSSVGSVNIKNNILWNNRPEGTRSRIQIASWIPITTLDHNGYYHSMGDAMFYYDGGYRTLATMKSTYGFELASPGGDIEDPLFVQPEGPDDIYGTVDDDYRLQVSSPAIDSGGALTGNFSVDLSGGDAWFEQHSGYSIVNFGLDDALCPNTTDWTQAIPVVGTVKRSGANWDRGAYAYID